MQETNNNKNIIGFTFFDDYLKNCEELSRKEQDQMIIAITRYVLRGEQPMFKKKYLQSIFNCLKFSLDKSKSASHPKENTDTSEKPKNRLQTEIKPDTNQNEIEMEADENQNEIKTESDQNQIEMNKNKNNIVILSNDNITAASGQQISFLPVENSPQDNSFEPSISNKMEKPDKRNVHVQLLLDWFESVYGFPPTDKKPRQAAYHIVQRMTTFCKQSGRDPTPERIAGALTKFCAWYASHDGYDHTEQMSTVFHKFDIWKAEIEGRRKTSTQ